MNTKWFTLLLLLSFAGFVLAAKAYLSNRPREVIQPPELGTNQRIYGEIPVLARRDAALSRVFRPRPRSLDPLPIMAMTRPIPEPVRPTLKSASPQASPKIDATTVAVAPAPAPDASSVAVAIPTPVALAQPVAETATATSAPAGGIDEAAKQADLGEVASATEADDSNSPADEVALAVHDVLKVEPAFAAPTEEEKAPEPTAESANENADHSDPAVSQPQVGAPSGPTGLQGALLAIADQIDSAAVRMRSNYENGPTVVLARAFDALSAGQFEAALRDFDAVLSRNVDLPQAWSGRGESLVGLNRFEEAAESYARAVSQAGAVPTARYNFGVVLYRLSRYSDATMQFRELVKQDPDHAEGHYNLATLAQRDGKLGEALEEWKVFTRLRPNVAGGWFNLGIVQMDYDRPAEAVACFKKVIELDRNDADAHINLAMACLASDQPAEALKALETAELRLPGDRVVLRYLADVHSQLAESGGPDAVMHGQAAEAYRAKITVRPTREARHAIAGSSIDAQP